MPRRGGPRHAHRGHGFPRAVRRARPRWPCGRQWSNTGHSSCPGHLGRAVPGAAGRLRSRHLRRRYAARNVRRGRGVGTAAGSMPNRTASPPAPSLAVPTGTASPSRGAGRGDRRYRLHRLPPGRASTCQLGHRGRSRTRGHEIRTVVASRSLPHRLRSGRHSRPSVPGGGLSRKRHRRPHGVWKRRPSRRTVVGQRRRHGRRAGSSHRGRSPSGHPHQQRRRLR